MRVCDFEEWGELLVLSFFFFSIFLFLTWTAGMVVVGAFHKMCSHGWKDRTDFFPSWKRDGMEWNGRRSWRSGRMGSVLLLLCDFRTFLYDGFLMDFGFVCDAGRI